MKGSRSRAVLALAVALVLAAGCTGAKKPSAERSDLAGKDGEPAETFTPGGSPGPSGSGAPGASNSGSGSSRSRGTVGTGARAATSGKPSGGGFTSDGGFQPSTLYSGAADRVGITKDTITLCAHAALTYGPAFNTSAEDLNVYWQALSEEKGGIFGRRVNVTYENDDYKPDTAIKAAETCKSRNPFFILGGIGFDQIPAVRDWAEKNKHLYFHHTATVKGSEGKQYSFTGLPTTEKMGEMFAELALWKFRDKRIGIIGRNSPNFMPGVEAFKKRAAGRLKIVAEEYPPKDQHNYGAALQAMEDKDAEVVWGWESALAEVEMIQQAKGRGYSPTWMVFPFNLESQTLGNQALNPKIYGVGMYQAYSYRDYTGEFAKYAADMKEFERQYAKYRPRADIQGVGGDLIFLNWSGQKALHSLLVACGKDCTRNKLIDAIHRTKVGQSQSVCALDFTRAGNASRGGYSVSIMETYAAPSGKVNWRNIATCREHVI